MELPEHYEEIDDPAEEETVLIDEDTPIEDIEEAEIIEDEPESDVEQKKRITVADYHRLEKQVALLTRMIGGTEWQD